MDIPADHLYEYNGFQGHENIRLFRLKPKNHLPASLVGSVNADVAIYGEIEHISAEASVSYTAISYAWDHRGALRPIRVGDKSFYISDTLEAAFLQIQRLDDDLLLWVDQICINQKDVKEKSEQVQQMNDIYSRAQSVIAWLGPATDESRWLMKMLDHISRDENLYRSQISQDFKAFRNWTRRTFAPVLPFLSNNEGTQNVLKAFDNFCSRKYWRRLWVMQEYAVARHLEIYCGDFTIPSARLQRALEAFGDVATFVSRSTDAGQLGGASAIHKAFNPFSCSYLQNVVFRRQKYRDEIAESSSFFQVLIVCSVLEVDYNHPECSEPRDRIFSLLGLSNDVAIFEGFPDYTISCKEVYIKTIRKLLDQGHIDILAFCQFPEGRRSCLPTWVPDWNVPVLSPNAYHIISATFLASQGAPLKQRVIHGGSDSVTLRGVTVDIVDDFGDEWHPDWLQRLEAKALLRLFEQIGEFAVRSARIPSGAEEIETARIAAVDWGLGHDPQQMLQALTSYRQIIATLKQIIANGERELAKEAEDWYVGIIRRLHTRRPFISMSGFVGLAPTRLQKGDVICIFLGGSLPYIVRRQNRGYTLIGEAYVHGIMYGEWMTDHSRIDTFDLW